MLSFPEALAGSSLMLAICAVTVGNLFLARWALRAPRKRWLGFVPVLMTVWLMLSFFVWASSQTPVK